MEKSFSPLSRRAFIRHVTAASIVAAGVPTQMAPASAAGLTSAQGTTLKMILNCLIPETDGLPGAGDLGIAGFVERAAIAAEPIREAVARVLASVSDAMPAMDGNDVDALLQRIERRHPDEFAIVLQAAYAGYYGAPEVLATLGWTDPSEGGGFTPFDAALLPSADREV